MACLCTTNTLSLFIRSLAQVEVASSSRHVSRGLQHFTPRGLRPRTLNGTTTVSRRAYSAEVSQIDDASHVRSRKTDHDNSVVDFSMDAIDAIAAESNMEHVVEKAPERVPQYETPLKSLMRGVPTKPPNFERPEVQAGPGGNGTRMIVRRNKADREWIPRERDPWKAQENRSKTGRFDMAKHDLPEEDGHKISIIRNKADQEWTPPRREPWMLEKERNKEKYPDGYKPLKRMSPDAMAGIRALHAQMPERYTVWALSQEFEMSPEAIRRILKSKWSPNSEEETDRQDRWFKRGKSVWSRYAELGVKPPKQWRDLGIGKGKPDWMLRKQAEREQQPLPALITTARRNETKHQSHFESSLSDKIF